MTHDEILARTTAVIADTLQSGPLTLTRETRAQQVRGWDSLSHTMIILALEDAFAVQLPIDRTLTLKNVGDLIDLIAETTTR